jgi:hypothetical protein
MELGNNISNIICGDRSYSLNLGAGSLSEYQIQDYETGRQA